jgi:Sec-independent protein translocase protein TatA
VNTGYRGGMNILWTILIVVLVVALILFVARRV